MKILGDTTFTEMIKKKPQKLSFQFSTNSCSSGDADIDVPSSQNCNTLPVEMYVSLQKTLITTRFTLCYYEKVQAAFRLPASAISYVRELHFEYL